MLLPKGLLGLLRRRSIWPVNLNAVIGDFMVTFEQLVYLDLLLLFWLERNIFY